MIFQLEIQLGLRRASIILALYFRSVCEIVPKGVLCFLASYRLLDQIYEFMETAGVLRQIQTIKRVLCEPRRSSQMNEIMAQYEEAITNSARYGPQCTGALMFAVFRGKVECLSEFFLL